MAKITTKYPAFVGELLQLHPFMTPLLLDSSYGKYSSLLLFLTLNLYFFTPMHKIFPNKVARVCFGQSFCFTSLSFGADGCCVWMRRVRVSVSNVCSDADARVERRLQQHHLGRRAPAASAAAVFGRFGHPSAFAAGDDRQLLRDGGHDAEAASPPGRPAGVVPAVGKPASPCGPRVHQQQRISGQPHHLPGRVRAAGSDG